MRRLARRLGFVVGFTGLLFVGWLTGNVITAIAQGAVFRVSTDCQAMSPAPPAGSFCIQLGVPPAFFSYTGTAWANVLYTDTTGTTVVLDAEDEIASVAVAGQSSAVMRIPANPTLINSTLIPVRSVDNGVTFVEDNAYFLGGATFSTAFVIGGTAPTDPTTLGIYSFVAATHLGVKVSVYGSGNASTTVRAMAIRPFGAAVGFDSTVPVMTQFTDLGGGIKAQNVFVPHVIAQYAYTRSTPGTMTNVNDACTISGSGAGQVDVEVLTGATGTVSFEGRFGAGTWIAANFLLDPAGTPSIVTSSASFPIRGHFVESIFTEYRARLSAVSAGTTTCIIKVAPGNFVRTKPAADFGAMLLGQTASVATAVAANAANACLPSATGLTAASNNDTTCKASAGNFYGAIVINPTATVPFLRMYDSTNQACDNATGFKYSTPLPASTAGSGFVALQLPEAFTTGIGFCVTGGSSSTDNTNAPAGIFVKVLYK